MEKAVKIMRKAFTSLKSFENKSNIFITMNLVTKRG